MTTKRSQIPDYYDTMYEDGYEPWEILAAAHKKTLEMAARPLDTAEEYDINIQSEVKVKQ